MKLSLILDFDRPIGLRWPCGIMTVKCSAEVWREYGRLYLRDFEADEELRPAEIEAAQDWLLDYARDHCELPNLNAAEMQRHLYR